MTSPTGRDLGSATGRIVIDVTSLQQAATVAQTVAKEINAAFASISGGALGNLAKITQAWAQAQTASYRTAAQEAQASAKVKVAAINQEIAAVEAQTKLEVQASKERIAQLKTEQGERRQAGSGGGAGGTGGAPVAGANYRFPTFIQFAAYPVGQLLSAVGAPGVGAGVMTAGALAGTVDQFAIIGKQVVDLGGRMRGLGGIFGALATAAGAAAAPLGATAVGLASILAVMLPIAVAIGGLALIINKLGESSRRTTEYLEKQQALNQQIAGGLTSAGLQEQITDTEQKRQADQETLNQLRGMNQRFVATQTFNPPETVTQVSQALSDLTGGQVTSWAQLGDAIQQQQAKVDGYTVSLGILNSQQGNTIIAANDLAELNNQLAKSWVDVAQQERELAKLNVEQLTQRRTAGQQEAATINQTLQLFPQMSDAQKKIYNDRLAQLQTEGDLIKQLLPAAIQTELNDFVTKANAARYQFGLQGQRTNEDRAREAIDKLFDTITTNAREAEDFLRQRNNAIIDFARDQTRAEEDYLDQHTKTERDFQQDALQRQQDLQDKLAQIIADSRIKILESAARLDARGVFEEQRRRNQQLAETNENARKDAEQRQEQYEQQLQDQEDQYNKQRQRAEDDFSQRLQREDAERAIRQQREAQDAALQQYRQEQSYQIQDARRLQDFARQIQEQASHYASMANIQDVYQNVMTLSWESFLLRMVTAVETAGTGGTTYGYQAPDNPLAGAGSAPWYHGASFAAGISAVIPAANNRAGGMGMTVNVGDIHIGDIGAYTPPQVRDMVAQGLRDGLLDEGLRAFYSQRAYGRVS